MRFAGLSGLRPDFCQAAGPGIGGIAENLVGYAKADLMVPQAPFDDLAAANVAAAQCAEVNGQGVGHRKPGFNQGELSHGSLPAFGPSASPATRTPVHPGYGDR